MANTNMGSTPPERAQPQPGGAQPPGATAGSPSTSTHSQPHGEGVAGAADEARERAKEVAAQAREEVSRVGHEAAERARSLFLAQREVVAAEVGTLAQALRTTSGDLDSREHPMLAGYVEQAARGIESCSRMLKERDMSELVDEASDFARRQPGIFLGGAMAAGFFIGRFLQSSSQRPHRRSGAAEHGDRHAFAASSGGPYASPTGAGAQGPARQPGKEDHHGDR